MFFLKKNYLQRWDKPLNMFCGFQIDDMTVKPSVPSQAVGEFYQQLKFYTLFLIVKWL